MVFSGTVALVRTAELSMTKLKTHIKVSENESTASKQTTV